MAKDPLPHQPPRADADNRRVLGIGPELADDFFAAAVVANLPRDREARGWETPPEVPPSDVDVALRVDGADVPDACPVRKRRPGESPRPSGTAGGRPRCALQYAFGQPDVHALRVGGHVRQSVLGLVVVLHSVFRSRPIPPPPRGGGVLEPPPGLQTRSWATQLPERRWWIKSPALVRPDFIHHPRSGHLIAQGLVWSSGAAPNPPGGGGGYISGPHGGYFLEGILN
jgi:hypothetical protein